MRNAEDIRRKLGELNERMQKTQESLAKFQTRVDPGKPEPPKARKTTKKK